MPGLSVRRSLPVFGGAFSWEAYWASLISATVEQAAPTHVVLTFPTAQPSLGASDFTIAGFTINSVSWTGAVLTLVLSTAVVYGDSLVVTFVKTGGTAAVTNNVAIAVPTGLTLTLISAGVQIDWTDTNGENVQTEIWGQSDGAAYALLYTVNAGIVTQNDNGVIPVDLRYYKIRAKDGATYSDYTAESSIAMLSIEHILNGGFSSSANWSFVGDASISGGYLNIAARTTAPNSAAYQSYVAQKGKKYILEFDTIQAPTYPVSTFWVIDFLNYNVGERYARDDNFDDLLNMGHHYVTVDLIDATDNGTTIYIVGRYAASMTGTWIIDNVSLKEVLFP